MHILTEFNRGGWHGMMATLQQLGTFISFQVTHVFQGELHKMKIVYSKCYKVLTELCLHIFWPGVPPLLLVTKFRNCLLVFIFDDKPISTLFPKKWSQSNLLIILSCWLEFSSYILNFPIPAKKINVFCMQ